MSALLPLVAGDRRAKTFCHGYRADSPGPDSRDDPHRPRGASRWVRHHGPASHLRGRTGSPATTGAPTTTVTRLRPRPSGQKYRAGPAALVGLVIGVGEAGYWIRGVEP